MENWAALMPRGCTCVSLWYTTEINGSWEKSIEEHCDKSNRALRDKRRQQRDVPHGRITDGATQRGPSLRSIYTECAFIEWAPFHNHLQLHVQLFLFFALGLVKNRLLNGKVHFQFHHLGTVWTCDPCAYSLSVDFFPLNLSAIAHWKNSPTCSETSICVAVVWTLSAIDIWRQMAWQHTWTDNAKTVFSEQSKYSWRGTTMPIELGSRNVSNLDIPLTHYCTCDLMSNMFPKHLFGVCVF